MDRDQFQVEIAHTEWMTTGDHPAQPTLQLCCTRSPPHLQESLSERLREDTNSDEIDVSVRFIPPDEETSESAQSVVSLTDRVTGAYLLETKTSPSRIEKLLEAVRAYADRTGNDHQYQVELRAGDKTLTAFTQKLLLVYDEDRTLLRQASLIPTGMEI